MYVDEMVDGFQSELRKIAFAKRAGWKSYLAPAAGGVALWELARMINRDRKLGRQLRIQQGSQGY